MTIAGTMAGRISGSPMGTATRNGEIASIRSSARQDRTWAPWHKDSASNMAKSLSPRDPSAREDAAANDSHTVSPYLNRRIRSLEEVQRDKLAAEQIGKTARHAVRVARANGARRPQQISEAIQFLMRHHPELAESVAAGAIRRIFAEDDNN